MPPVARISLFVTLIFAVPGLTAPVRSQSEAQNAGIKEQAAPAAAEFAKARAQRAAIEARLAADRMVVDRFVPKDLVPPPNRDASQDCFAVYKRTPAGDPATIFAVYRDGDQIHGELRMIERDAAGKYSAHDVTPQDFDFGALQCSADVLTIDRAGTRVLEISLAGVDPDEAVYLLRWDGTRFTSIGPTEMARRGIASNLMDPWFVNLYGDGTLAASSDDKYSREVSSPVPVSIYRLRQGDYALSAHGVDLATFVCGPRCEAQTDEFTVSEDSRGPYVLQLGNGDLDGRSRVHAAHIRINGKEIAGVAKLNERIGALTIPIPALHPGGNIISAMLVRAAGVQLGKLNYAILDHPAK
jgi:hypothetical protein